MVDRVLQVVDRQVRVSIAGGPLIAALAANAAAEAVEPIADRAEAAQAAIAAILATAGEVQSGGSVTFQQAGTGAVVRDLQSKARDIVNVRDFGATGDGVTNDTAAIQAAIDSLGILGGRLYIPRGTYLVTDHNSDGACLMVTAPILFTGDGQFSAIKPADTVAATVDTIVWDQNVAIFGQYAGIQNLTLGDPTNATRQGRHGVYMKTLAYEKNLRGFLMSACIVFGSVHQDGYAFYHENDPGVHVNGGLNNAVIQYCYLEGGIRLLHSGDSINIDANILTDYGIGVWAQLIDAGDGPASKLTITRNNITSAGGAVRVDAGRGTIIRDNNIEHKSHPNGGAKPAANTDSVTRNSRASAKGAVIYFAGGATEIDGSTIYGNLLTATGSSDATEVIAIGNADGVGIRDNEIMTGLGGQKGIHITAGAYNTRIGPQSWSSGLALADRVVDLGVGTVGKTRDLELLGGWAAVSGYAPAKFSKDEAGWVSLSGSIGGGSSSIATLPVGFRPAALQEFGARSFNGTIYEPATLLIDSAGAFAQTGGGNTRLSLNGIRFQAAGGSDGSIS